MPSKSKQLQLNTLARAAARRLQERRNSRSNSAVDRCTKQPASKRVADMPTGLKFPRVRPGSRRVNRVPEPMSPNAIRSRVKQLKTQKRDSIIAKNGNLVCEARSLNIGSFPNPIGSVSFEIICLSPFTDDNRSRNVHFSDMVCVCRNCEAMIQTYSSLEKGFRWLEAYYRHAA